MSRPHRRRPSIRPCRAFESLERRGLLCADHAASFQWTDPHDPASLARERLRIASLNDLTPPKSFAALSAAAAAGDVTGLPILNSNPGASVDIFLDFDGDTRGQLVTPYDTDGDTSSFDAAEASVITQAWQLVSAYFSMFDVNVTTDAPTKPFAWCAIGNNINGGYSYVGVFPQSSGGGPQSFASAEFARTRASGIAHEVGHNFGLQHQGDYDALGRLTAEYTSGSGAQHGALMGVDYAQRVHKWMFGHPSNNVSQLQDDMAVIAGRIVTIGGGDGYRNDDIGNTIATATASAVSGVSQVRAGVIERLADRDAVSFTSAGGRYLVAANRTIESPVDLKLEVYDAAGHLLAAEDPSAENDAQLALDLPAGTYYAIVASHGNYGDLGSYAFSASPMQDGLAFESSDVGIVPRRAGGASYDASANAWTVHGAGTDIGGLGDQFRYVYQSLRGDGSITARVAALTNGHTGAKAGVMVRESLAARARQVTLAYRNDGIVERIARAVADASATTTSSGAASPGVWLRLTRGGNVFTAERSTDGVAWSIVDSITVEMGSEIVVGLAVTSKKELTVAEARFDHVSVTGATGPVLHPDNGLPAPGGLTVAPTPAGSGLSVSWNAVSGAVAYGVERSLDGVNFTPIATTAGTSHTDPDLDGAYRYFYRVRALTEPTSAARSTPAVASGVNRSRAVSIVRTMSLGTSAIAIGWSDTVGETGYRVERSPDNWATVNVVATLPANRTAYHNRFLSGSTNYAYRVVPLTTIGDGTASVPVVEGTRLVDVDQVRVLHSTPHSLTVQWDDLESVETGYRIERSTNATTWTTLATVDGDAESFTDVGLVSFKPYYYRVTAVSPYSEGVSGTLGVGATQSDPATNPLPAGWDSANLSEVAGSGATAVTGTNAFRLISGAPSPYAGTDQYHFAYRPFNGDGEIIARIDSRDSTVGSVGLMFRESLAADSRFVYVSLGAFSDQAESTYRTTIGGTLSTVAGMPTGGSNVWLRLTRVGDVVSSYQSTNGETWSLIGTATVTLGDAPLAGLAVLSEAVEALVTANFSHVTGSAIVPPDVDPPAVLSSSFDRQTGHRWTVQLSEDVGASLTAGDFAIVNRTTGASITPTLSYNPSTHVATLGVSALLGDGRYELRLAAGAIADLAGNVSNASHTLPFNVMAGDFNDDGAVDFNDLLILASHFGQTGLGHATGNANYDPAGTVDFDDLLIVAKSFNTTLPAPAAEATATRSTRKRSPFATLPI